MNWFKDNSMKANPGKYHLLLSGNGSSKTTIKQFLIVNAKNFSELKQTITLKSILNLCVKNQVKNDNALSRLASSMSFIEEKI